MDLDNGSATGSETGSEGQNQSDPLPEILIGIAGFIGNLLVIVSIVRAKFMHNVTSKLLVSLAVCDLTVCLNVALFSSAVLDVGGSVRAQSVFLGYMACKMFGDRILVWIPSTASVMHLVLLTYERYVAIVRPFRYAQRFEMRRVYAMIASTWVLSVLLQVPYMITNDYDATLWICKSQSCGSQISLQVFFIATNVLLIILPTIAMLWSYWRILGCLRKDARRLQMDNADGPARELNLARRRIVQTLLTVVVAFILLWFPEMIIDTARNFDCQLNFPAKLEKAFLLMTFSNSAVNPLIYVFKYKGFRRALKLAVCPFCCKGTIANEVGPMSLQ